MLPSRTFDPHRPNQRPATMTAAAAALLLATAACGGANAAPAAASAARAPAEPQGPQPGVGEFTAYRQTMPRSEVAFDMVPVAGGRFRMGSPADEPGRDDDEGPPIEVEVEPFWMGRCEVTWAEYDLWNTDTERPQSKRPDGIARPTPPYVDMTFQMGRDGYPAIGMSHVAARQYCKWLSDQTGRFHRLPTEAEWEYACRAGAATAYAFGDDPARLGEFAWFGGNSARELERGAKPVPAYQKVGTKPANAWGLCDLHGNVAEWVADAYLADAYAEAHGAAPRRAPYLPPGRDASGRPVRFPHTVRGGSWRDAAPALRSAAREPSVPEWNERDPQIPKSWWYLTDAQHIGFRVVRPWREPTAAERKQYEEP
ncbi:MAG: formylglycine-generating enzyme family protein [Planctomycetes bacterium]|nr:formylglycine-generating enzyme family protein [Planctomycetota bacterium]